MKEIITASASFGFFLTLAAFLTGTWLKRKTGLLILNPILTGAAIIIIVLLVFNIDYDSYQTGAAFISYYLTPVTICLAIPLYKQISLLKDNLMAVLLGITAGVAANGLCILGLAMVFRLDSQLYVSLLPKSITTAIAVGITSEHGGIAAVTVAAVIATGVSGAIISDILLKLLGITHPIAQGLAMGTGAHAIGTSRALEMGEIQGAMGSLAIAVAGLMTVIAVPFLVPFI